MITTRTCRTANGSATTPHSSGYAIEAYLLLPKQPPDPRQPEAALAALEFHTPGARPASFVLSFAHGEYRTTRLIFERFDAIATRTDVPHQTPLGPRPAHSPVYPARDR